MFEKFYKKKEKNTWTKSRLLAELFRDKPYVSTHNFNLIQPNKAIGVYVVFERLNFPNRTDTVELIASVFFKDEDGNMFTWFDLREVGSMIYGRKHSDLTIKRTADLKESALYHEFQEVYFPLMDLLSSKSQLARMVKGEEFVLAGKKIQLRNIEESDVVKSVLNPRL